MSRTARLRVADAATDAGDRPGISAVVDLVAQGWDETSEPAEEPPSYTEFAATIDLVRSVAGRVRHLHGQARAEVAEQRQIARIATGSAQAAKVRADEAEARVRVAVAEAEQIGRQMRELKAKLVAAETRAAQAEIRAQEAQTWLRRLHDCMANEFTALTVAPL